MINHRIIIIGAGAAGISAAIQLKRFGLKPLVFEKREIGGLLHNANLVENYPGFPEGISGHALVELFKRQLDALSLKIFLEEVEELDYKNGLFLVKTRHRTTTAPIAIIASGTKPRQLFIPNADAEIKKRIFFEVHPLADIAGKRIVIVGAGDCAFDYALNCAKKNTVTILNRGAKVKCLPLLWARARGSKKISYQANTRVRRIESRNGGLILFCTTPLSESELHTHYLLVAVGRKPYLDFLSESLKKEFSALRAKKVLYVIGDVKNKADRQVAIAVGDGIKTAIQIYTKLNEIEL